MKVTYLSESELKDVCGGLSITLVRAGVSPNVPLSAEAGIVNALTNVISSGHTIANIQTPFDQYYENLPSSGSQSGQFG